MRNKSLYVDFLKKHGAYDYVHNSYKKTKHSTSTYVDNIMLTTHLTTKKDLIKFYYLCYLVSKLRFHFTNYNVIIRFVNEDYFKKLKLRYKKTGLNFNIMGTYMSKGNTKIIYIKNIEITILDDILYHEIGHMIDNMNYEQYWFRRGGNRFLSTYDYRLSDVFKKEYIKVENIMKLYPKSKEEYYAQCFSALIRRKTTFLKDCPDTVTYIEKSLLGYN